MATDDDSRLMDLSPFKDRDTSLQLATGGCPTMYTVLASRYISEAEAMTLAHLLYMSMISRFRGLHEGALRAIAAGNPHSAFLLIRGYTEVAAILLYVNKEPSYIGSLMADPRRGGRGRKSFEAIFHAIADEAPGFRAVYRSLSDYGHFGVTGVFSAHRLSEDREGATEWSDVPHWRSDKEFKIACSQMHELGEMVSAKLDEFGRLFLTPPFATDTIGDFTGKAHL